MIQPLQSTNQTNTLTDTNEQESEELEISRGSEEDQSQGNTNNDACSDECPIAKLLSVAVPTNGQPAQSSSVTITINGKERIFTRKIPDIINDGSKHIHLFEMTNHLSDYRIETMFHYIPYNGRLSRIGKAVTGHVCPCVIKYNPNHTVQEGKYIAYERKDIILLSMWRTRCNAPVFHLVLLVPGENECRIYKENIPMFLKTRYCDPTAAFDEDSAIK